MQSQSQDTREATMLQKLESWWQDWRRRQLENSEIAGFDAGQLDLLARDAGAASAGELLEVIGKGPKGSALMREMAATLGVDLASMAIAHPDIVRQMEVSCSVCDTKRRCTCELADGTAAKHYGEFCNNAEVFDSLKR